MTHEVKPSQAKDIYADFRRLHALRALCGYVEDGSATTVSIGQDDATRDWIVTVGEQSYYDPSFYQALDAAIKGERT